jgi:hypothetical protein
MSTEFERELEQLINKHSMENASNTPDFILADYLMKCLETYNNTIRRRSEWYKPDVKTSVNEIAPAGRTRVWEICTVYPITMPMAYCGYNGQNLLSGYEIHALKFIEKVNGKSICAEELQVGDFVKEGQIERFHYFGIGNVKAEVRLISTNLLKLIPVEELRYTWYPESMKKCCETTKKSYNGEKFSIEVTITPKKK